MSRKRNIEKKSTDDLKRETTRDLLSKPPTNDSCFIGPRLCIYAKALSSSPVALRMRTAKLSMLICPKLSTCQFGGPREEDHTTDEHARRSRPLDLFFPPPLPLVVVLLGFVQLFPTQRTSAWRKISLISSLLSLSPMLVRACDSSETVTESLPSWSNSLSARRVAPSTSSIFVCASALTIVSHCDFVAPPERDEKVAILIRGS